MCLLPLDDTRASFVLPFDLRAIVSTSVSLPDLKFSCPACGQHISASPEDAGVSGLCPACNGTVIVPTPARPRRAMPIVGGVILVIALAAGGVYVTQHRPAFASAMISKVRTAKKVSTPASPTASPQTPPPATTPPVPGSVAAVAVEVANPPLALDGPRKYAALDPNEADKLAREKAGKGEFDAAKFNQTFQPPPEGHFSEAVKIGENDYVMLVAVEPRALNMVPRANIATILPVVDDAAIKPLISFTTPDNILHDNIMAFRLNGFLSTSVDVSVVDNVVVQRTTEDWVRHHGVIPKGVYQWSLGAIGILLEDSSNNQFIIAFAKPFKEVVLNERQKNVLIKFGVSPLNAGAGGISFSNAKWPEMSFVVK